MKSNKSKRSQRSGGSRKSDASVSEEAKMDEEGTTQKKKFLENMIQETLNKLETRSNKSGRSRVSLMKNDEGSVRSVESKNSKRSRRSGSSRKSDASVSEEILINQLALTLQRLQNQITHMEALLKMRDVEMMKGELRVMDQMHETALSTFNKCVGVVTEEKIKDDCMLLKEIGQRMFEIKKEVLEWLKNIEEDQSSVASKSSRRSGGSRNSRLSLERMNKVGEESQQDRWKRDFDTQKNILDNQKARCKDMVVFKGTQNVKEEIKLLEKTHQEAIAKASMLEGFLPETDAEKMAKWVNQEKDEIVQIKHWMIRNVDDGGQVAIENSDHVEADSGESASRVAKQKSRMEERKKGKEDNLKTEVMKIKERLGRQKEIINDLLKANDSEMVNRELESLDKIYDDLVAAASQLRKVLDHEDDSKRLSDTIDAEDSKVFEFEKESG